MGQVVVCHLLVPPGLFLLQCLGRVGAGGAEGLPEDGDYGNREGEDDGSDIDPPYVLRADAELFEGHTDDLRDTDSDH